MRGYDMTEERAREIRAELDRRKSGSTPDLSAKYQRKKR